MDILFSIHSYKLMHVDMMKLMNHITRSLMTLGLFLAFTAPTYAGSTYNMATSFLSAVDPIVFDKKDEKKKAKKRKNNAKKNRKNLTNKKQKAQNRKKQAKQQQSNRSKGNDKARSNNRNSQHQQAYEAQKRGDIKAYNQIKKSVERSTKGKVVGQRLLNTNQGWVYQLTVRSENGRVSRVVVDARTGRILNRR